MSTDMISIDFPGYKPLEVILTEPDDFLKVRETLTRIGVASRKDKTLFQSCHILHKQGHYFIVHFKELFALDGKTADLSDKISNPDYFTDYAPLSQIKVISHKEKNEWMLETKYNIGKKKLTTSTK